MHTGLQVKHPQFLTTFKETRVISRYFRKIFKHQISWKSIHCEPSCSIHSSRRMDGWTDGQTDITKLIDAFRKFAKAPNYHRYLFLFVIARNITRRKNRRSECESVKRRCLLSACCEHCAWRANTCIWSLRLLYSPLKNYAAFPDTTLTSDMVFCHLFY
jgi:hypothetical protein